MSAYRGNNPKRRIARLNHFTLGELRALSDRAVYEGSALHKLKVADYDFHPPTNPRPVKSLCDDIRVIKLAEATKLFQQAFATGMISVCDPNGLPKYVWAVDQHGEAYEAKLGRDGRYHGYRLGDDDSDMRDWVLEEWETRGP